MKKKTYEKPTMTVVELQHRTCLLQASGEQQPDAVPPYDDWLGAKENKGDFGSLNLWNEEW